MTSSVTLDPGDSPDAAGVDPIDYALSVAEVVVPALGVAPPNEEETAAGDALQPLADAAGVDPSELTLLMDANARDADSGEMLGSYAAIQVAGLDGEQLEAAIVSWMGTVSGEDVSTDVLSLGGKDVTALSAGGQLRGYLYVAGDIVHTFTMSEEVAAKILETLP